MNLLMVEDESALAFEMADFLGKEGYQIEDAWKWASASEKIFTTVHDFILLDLGLPDWHDLNRSSRVYC